MADFVARDSIVRRIWSDGDLVLLVFAGCAAEFALNRTVDWLFFTGRLPNDPIGRLFATARYAQEIVFADDLSASHAFERIRCIHESVERQRGQAIPDWAHRDVLYMLIDYSERAHALMVRPMTRPEQEDLHEVFHRVGTGLRIPGLPRNYADWVCDRELHLRRDLVYSSGTRALYEQYQKQLGAWRYDLLLEIQGMLAPGHVRSLLGLKPTEWLRPALRVYPMLVRAGLRSVMQQVLMPSRYLEAIRNLDQRRFGAAAASCHDFVGDVPAQVA